MLAAILQDPSITTVQILGSQKQLQSADVHAAFDQYHLTPLLRTPQDLDSRVVCVPGTLSLPRFGLSLPEFRRLGQKIQAIYHLGGHVALLQSYDALHTLNVLPVHDILHLTTLGRVQTHIHHLSTWSVPHLQSWSTTTSSTTAMTIDESSARHFTPEPHTRLGYFKTRWAAEMLMESAADRGFPVTIYRASAATAHSTTGVSEPKDDFIRTMIVSMVSAEAVPQLSPSEHPFAVDFVPVDYLTEGFHALATASQALSSGQEGATIYHLCNPSPLPISQLPDIVGEVKGKKSQDKEEGAHGKVLPVDEWLEKVARLDDTPDAQVRWAVLKEYLDLGHCMFGLETGKTRLVLRSLGVDDKDVQMLVDFALLPYENA